MSRSGYSEDIDDNWQLIKWRGQVASAIRGRRGQRFFKDLIAALDALPEKRLIRDELVTAEGAVCALGALGLARGVPMDNVDPEDAEQVSALFDIAVPLAQETVFENDEAAWGQETPEGRFRRMRAWAAKNISPESDT